MVGPRLKWTSAVVRLSRPSDSADDCVLDEGGDLGFEIIREEVVFETDAVLQRLGL